MLVAATLHTPYGLKLRLPAFVRNYPAIAFPLGDRFVLACDEKFRKAFALLPAMKKIAPGKSREIKYAGFGVWKEPEFFSDDIARKRKGFTVVAEGGTCNDAVFQVNAVAQGGQMIAGCGRQ